MGELWTEGRRFRAANFKNEADLEKAILLVKDSLFGPSRIYLDVKKKIGRKGGLRNIPDGYLIDLGSLKPRLYVVENELASHDPLRHIAVQILQFSLSFETDQHSIKRILLEAVQQDPEAAEKCKTYAKNQGYRNLDHLLEYLVWEVDFAALVVIDEIPDNLEKVLLKRFSFAVEVLQLA